MASRAQAAMPPAGSLLVYPILCKHAHLSLKKAAGRKHEMEALTVDTLGSNLDKTMTGHDHNTAFLKYILYPGAVKQSSLQKPHGSVNCITLYVRCYFTFWQDIFLKVSRHIHVSCRTILPNHKNLVAIGGHAHTHFSAIFPHHLGKMTCGKKQRALSGHSVGLCV